jgi:hypothetical protein
MAKLKTGAIQECIDTLLDDGISLGHDDDLKLSRKAQRELNKLTRRIAELEHEIKHWMGDCDCTKYVDP